MIQQPTDLEFLTAIFKENTAFAYITGFPDDPSNITNDRRQICWGGGYAKDTCLYPDQNNYFTISVFNPDETGKARRRKALFMATYVIVADDVAEKIPVEQANLLPPPSYKLQSSNGSEQWGWILDHPCTDRAVVENLLDGLVEKGLAPSGKDPGMKGVTRFIRLPNSKNTKASRIAENGGIPPDVYITEWSPERTVSMEALAIPFGINLQAPRRDARVDGASDLPDHPILNLEGIINVKQVLSPGRFDITCPWIAEHTGGADDGAVVFTNDDGTIGFKCHHGCCEQRTSRDLLLLIEGKSPGFKEQLVLYKLPMMFQDATPATTTVINQSDLPPAIEKTIPVAGSIDDAITKNDTTNNNKND